MTKLKYVYEALKRASSYLEENGREEGAARVLLQHQLGLSYSGLMASMRDEITEAQLESFWTNIELHTKGIPVQHLTGTEEFYGRQFRVNADVLIPRPETEELIEETLQLIERHMLTKEIAIADIGTGSGVIAITMKCELPQAQVTATDISEPALQTAMQNAEELNAEIDFRLGDVTKPIENQKWDVILSNPPYIAYAEAPGLSDSVRDFEPHHALFADNEGLALYEKMAKQFPELLNKPGIIGFEIGYQQGAAVEKMLKRAFPTALIYCKKDINKNDRMVFAVIE
ncbi:MULTISPECIES: peptide chain release factor N(5)-glutamine methyltransferase [Planococcus]|uniref:Release factor glutamine methyltransferase n=1 Tax=Planococcus faecalis TaxID=1598147 RepID=A0ABN4XSZ4_9BACL|nr:MULTISPECIES: peptide chain release factor N(5)-glutamine methyltransferase [Planococcus]AQU80314.1 protein-(glutamine-N5) methyltransferase, release factor-specific [Planococcus faecalis]MDJ0330392.1 peptide chain release factor N(5)-glutamine methyltransferase [Planococcus sp. S3-L1]OHX55067.1 protein-(glutamine-N5) methyltransferase, release factor-specific [Planococcus faecalis]